MTAVTKIRTLIVDDEPIARERVLTLLQHQPTLGRTPRNFAVDPAGDFLVAANQDSNALVVFAIDPDTGRLTPTGDPTEVPVPVCVLFT